MTAMTFGAGHLELYVEVDPVTLLWEWRVYHRGSAPMRQGDYANERDAMVDGLGEVRKVVQAHMEVWREAHDRIEGTLWEIES